MVIASCAHACSCPTSTAPCPHQSGTEYAWTEPYFLDNGDQFRTDQLGVSCAAYAPAPEEPAKPRPAKDRTWARRGAWGKPWVAPDKRSFQDVYLRRPVLSVSSRALIPRKPGRSFGNAPSLARKSAMRRRV